MVAETRKSRRANEGVEHPDRAVDHAEGRCVRRKTPAAIYEDRKLR
jgi:hypothetical protein